MEAEIVEDSKNAPDRETRSDGIERVKVSAAQSGPNQDGDAALERALILAAEAGRFDVVAQLAEELRVRRLAK